MGQCQSPHEDVGWDIPGKVSRAGWDIPGKVSRHSENGHQAGSRDKRKAIAELTVFPEGCPEPGAQHKVAVVSFEKPEMSMPPPRARMLHREV